jgi:hypothetical protein
MKVIGRQEIWWHLVARFHTLGIPNPDSKVLGCIRQGSGSEREARRNMR